MIKLEDVAGRMFRGLADAKRRIANAGSADAAESVFRADRTDADEWLRITADRHTAYRERVRPADGAVAVVCVTNRPAMLEHIRANVRRQAHRPNELILVMNAEGFDGHGLEALRQQGRQGGTRVSAVDCVGLSLGECLNVGLEMTTSRFVAKFDDDDRYGPRYLDDALRAHRYSGAGVVGKHTYYAYLESTDELVLRFPGRDFEYSGTLAGGTLVIDRHRTGDLQFPPISLGEDRAFLRRCHRRAISTFAADRFNFLQVRSDDNTWAVARGDFLANSSIVECGLDLEQIDV